MRRFRLDWERKEEVEEKWGSKWKRKGEGSWEGMNILNRLIDKRYLSVYDMENRKISHFIQALWHPYGAWKWPFLTKWEIHCLPHYPHIGPFQKNSHLVRVWPRKNGKKREEMHENIKTKLRKFFLPFFWLNVTAIMLGLTSIPQNIFTYLLMKNK